jgi:hypothetical protein
MSDSGYSGSDDEAMCDAENLLESDFSDECLDRMRFRSPESAVQVLKTLALRKGFRLSQDLGGPVPRKTIAIGEFFTWALKLPDCHHHESSHVRFRGIEPARDNPKINRDRRPGRARGSRLRNAPEKGRPCQKGHSNQPIPSKR